MLDVVAVNIKTGKVVAIYGENKTERNAEAIIKMAVMRQGVEENFYADVPTGSHKVGDTYQRGR